MLPVKEEKPSLSPVLPPSPFSPALRQDSHKHDSKHRFDLKPSDGSRLPPRLPDSPAPPQHDIKQEPKTPIAPKKTQEVKLKNMGSWASLAQRSQSTPASSVRSSSDSFEQFRRAAREKEERERQLKAEQARREGKLRRDDDDPVEPPRRVQEETRRPAPQQPTPPPPSPAAIDQREILRRREQERRRREAMADTIDINFQSDLMAIFEENLF
ncbi:hypothetical protein KUCAC02_029705 [Chaenocephalus aceratus]|nr:hypothetical protein KUCAC02_029705 [Chaenocephalus aceratus]